MLNKQTSTDTVNPTLSGLTIDGVRANNPSQTAMPGYSFSGCTSSSQSGLLTATQVMQLELTTDTVIPAVFKAIPIVVIFDPHVGAMNGVHVALAAVVSIGEALLVPIRP